MLETLPTPGANLATESRPADGRRTAAHATLLGVASGLGQLRPGVERGPETMRRVGLHATIKRLGYEVEDMGDTQPPDRSAANGTEGGLRNASGVLDVCGRHAAALAPLLATPTTPIILGGDHSLSLGTWAALARAGRNTALLWVDAHGDFNTAATSPSGNAHGMPLAAIAGFGEPRLTEFIGSAPLVQPEDVVLLGIRDVDPAERARIRDAGINYVTIDDVEELGIGRVMDDVVDVLTHGGREFHVSFDVDAVDPVYAPGTGTPVPGGLNYRETRILMRRLAETGRMGSLEVVEVNPWLDRDDATSKLAVDVVAYGLGEAIV